MEPPKFVTLRIEPGPGAMANDADSLVVALSDPESREAARRYLAARRFSKS